MNTSEAVNAVIEAIDGMITYSGNNIPAYGVDAPEGETGDFILVYPESVSEDNTKGVFSDNVIIITDVVTMFENVIDHSVVDDIDEQVRAIIVPTPSGSGLTKPGGIQFLNMTRASANYITESGSKRIYRKVSRYSVNMVKQ